ncbi:MAG: SpoIIE family protein phosphatase [Hoeflea sp.]|uniref:SpoIIE family protein phosphatase n=1 Tax=Hoeflea sp. TaxID=1940281 RepID=UPI00329A263C
MNRIFDRFKNPANFLAILLSILLLGLPIAVWLDLRELTDEALTTENTTVGEIIDAVRSFYANEILGRIEPGGGDVQFTHEFRDVHHAIPIPATFSKELAGLISENDGNISYRFVSDYPFIGRGDNELDDFEIAALAAFRAGLQTEYREATGSLFNRKMRIATPVLMGKTCVACHNSHEQSPKKDWSAGEVRGIQAITSQRQLASNIFAFKYLLAYFLLAGTTSVFVLVTQQSQSRKIVDYNTRLKGTNIALEETQTELTDTLGRLEDDLENARQFQELALPQSFPRQEALDCASYFIPARHVGGDFFDIFELPGNKVGFVMADVSDKGVKAAFFAAITRSVLLDIATAERDPASALSLVNERLLTQNPSDLFVTMLYGIIEIDQNSLTFGNCAHQTPLLRKADGTTETLKVDPCVPVGLFPEIKPGKCHIPFAEGDTFIVYTDGVTDAGTHAGSAFGEARIMELIANPSLNSAVEMADQIRSSQQAHAPGDQFDDSAVLVIRRLPISEPEQTSS